MGLKVLLCMLPGAKPFIFLQSVQKHTSLEDDVGTFNIFCKTNQKAMNKNIYLTKMD